jgi:hypothetical protein
MEYNIMRELNVNEIEEVNGGFVALYWIGVGAVQAYRTYKLVRTFSAGVAAGVGGELATD